MKKKVIIGGIVAVLIVAIAIATILIINTKQEDIINCNEELDLLFEAYSKDEDSDVNEKTVIVSISNKKDQAIVKVGRGESIEEAFKNVKKQVNSYVKENKYSAKWIKFDVIYESASINTDELNELISKYKSTYYFRRGMILNVKDEDIFLLEAEVNSNRIVDYSDMRLSLENLNAYLEKQGKSKIDKFPESVRLFTTVSYFCDEDKKIYKLHDDDLNMGRRVLEKLKKEDINSIIEKASRYLSNMVKADGEFIYGYRAVKDINLGSYNNLRHAGSVWALIACYDENYTDKEQRKAAIVRAMDYLVDDVINRDENTSYIIDRKTNDIKIGGNAIAILAMCEYKEKFNDPQYIDIANHLANGILTMQNKDGSYNHVISSTDYEVINEQQVVYYDGESTLALAKLYGITKEDKYIEAAKKAMDYFIDNDYIQYCDHWIAYSANEITKYVDDIKYYEFGLKNINENLDDIYNKEYSSHTNLEMLVQGYDLYKRAIEKNLDFDYLKEFSYEGFKETLDYRLDFQLNSYMYPETAMYLTNPSKYLDAFYIRSDGFRIRIDDIQHSLLGYYNYTKLMEE